MRRRPVLLWVMTLLALVGIGLSTTSLITHYQKSKTEFCDLDQQFNCDMVNRGPYATFATTAPLVFEADPGQPAPWLERVGDAFTAHVMKPLNDLALRLGIRLPVAGIGLAGYALLLALTWLGRRRRSVAVLQFVLATLALIFCLYLTYLEKYVIAFWCILCLASLGVITLITIFSAVRVFRSSYWKGPVLVTKRPQARVSA